MTGASVLPMILHSDHSVAGLPVMPADHVGASCEVLKIVGKMPAYRGSLATNIGGPDVNDIPQDIDPRFTFQEQTRHTPSPPSDSAGEEGERILGKAREQFVAYLTYDNRRRNETAVSRQILSFVWHSLSEFGPFRMRFISASCGDCGAADHEIPRCLDRWCPFRKAA